MSKNVIELIATKRRILALQEHIAFLLETHEAVRLAHNHMISGYVAGGGVSKLDHIPAFSAQDRVQTEPSAPAAIVTYLTAVRREGATFEQIVEGLRRAAPHASKGSIQSALSRLIAKGAVIGTRGMGAVYMASENAEVEAGYMRRRRRRPVTQRLSPGKVADPSDYAAAAAAQLILDGPMTGPELLPKLERRMAPGGDASLKRLETILGKDPAIESTPYGYWISGLQLPDEQEGRREQAALGTRSGRRRKPSTGASDAPPEDA